MAVDSHYRSPTYPLGVMVVGVDGSDPHTITTVHGAGYAFAFPQWSPDGQTIAFYDGNDGEHDIRTVAADGSAEPLVSDAPEDEYWPYLVTGWNAPGIREELMVRRCSWSSRTRWTAGR